MDTPNPDVRGVPRALPPGRVALIPVRQPLEPPGGVTANPATVVTNATPVAGSLLRQVDIGSRKPWANILAIFSGSAGRQDTLSVRAPGKDGDLNTALGVGYYNAQGQALRGTAAQSGYAQGKRAQMNPLPTPQALLRQVTGIGDPVQGR